MNDAEIAIGAVRAGAEVVHRHFGSALTRLDKGAGDFATNADVEAERAILALLRLHRPDDDVLGEETGKTGTGIAPRTWFVDPLCGTLNYAASMFVVAVNAALMADGRAVAAAVADPCSGEVFWTDGAAAWVRAAGRDTVLAPNAHSALVDLNFDPPFPNERTFRATRLTGLAGFVSRFRPRVVSSSLALAWVATGQRAAYVTDGDVRGSVHFAAGLAICAAAGCVLSDLNGDPWGTGITGLVVAADATTHASLLDLVKNCRTPAKG